MFFGDIPIWLINTALWCMVATPFAIAAAAVYLAHKLEKPGWALYWYTRDNHANVPAPLPPPAPWRTGDASEVVAPNSLAPEVQEAAGKMNRRRAGRMTLSTFGR